MPKRKKSRTIKSKRRARGRKPSRVHRSTRKSKPPLREIPTDLDLVRRRFMAIGSVRGATDGTSVSGSRLYRLIRRYKLARWDRKKRKWISTDRLVREVAAHTTRGYMLIKLRGFSQTSLAMSHFAARNAFLASNDVALLAPFKGSSVTDVSGKKHLLETRPNVLLRLANAGSDADMKIYRLID
jgi:hypothetical protein